MRPSGQYVVVQPPSPPGSPLIPRTRNSPVTRDTARSGFLEQKIPRPSSVGPEGKHGQGESVSLTRWHAGPATLTAPPPARAVCLCASRCRLAHACWWRVCCSVGCIFSAVAPCPPNPSAGSRASTRARQPSPPSRRRSRRTGRVRSPQARRTASFALWARARLRRRRRRRGCMKARRGWCGRRTGGRGRRGRQTTMFAPMTTGARLASKR